MQQRLILSCVAKLYSFSRLIFIVLVVMPASLSAAPEESRYAALECQNVTRFVIVNFYPGGIFKLTFGVNDEVLRADKPVTREITRQAEIFAGKDLRLVLPLATDETAHRERVGHFLSTDAQFTADEELDCLLHSAD